MYEYRVIKVPAIADTEDYETVMNRMAEDDWRLTQMCSKQTLGSDQIIMLIFERQK
ncbi:protein of unknown function [Thermoactinomyces sp. DSM 45891]|uniref:DUF4177 domain-containing protein n=1 Tax=Thermoactinomyces sp. DSM 45891 TaxID=1761907 RepID=UPI000918A763|nr:DUF4177 domain-containing protein [Thermoactinomyces sp. DSM 45891]SFX31379.1 protein of unknown function [Thermoactinomyces sp. DSM 45891]